MPNLMETELESFGAATVEDFTWKQLLDTDACTMCGRCTSVCPAHATGKPLDPRDRAQGRRGHGRHRHAAGVAADRHRPRRSPIGSDSVFERITPEEIWACTSCKACDEICPVNIEILDKILDMRRYLSLMESNFPTELGNAVPVDGELRQPVGHEPGRPGGVGRRSRASPSSTAPRRSTTSTSTGSAAPAPSTTRTRRSPWPWRSCCSGAGVDFAILGPAEICTGDPARRSGNEYIFQMLAMQNIETLNGMGVKKIITQCPHCFNTLMNEYPQLGGHYEVVHHSQLLEHLIESGKLDLSTARLDERIVYHDSCYLGRHNDVYLAPRKVIGSLGGIEVVEAERNGTKGMCCGAGGARMWMEETIGKKVNDERSQELIATGAPHRDRVPLLLHHDRRRREGCRPGDGDR